MTDSHAQKSGLKRRSFFYMVELVVLAILAFSAGLILGANEVTKRAYPQYCYFENGTVTAEYAQGDQFFVDYINDDGENGTVWFYDGWPEGDSNRLVLRWCWIPPLEAFRVRGAWKE